jgi:hypothetical protein
MSTTPVTPELPEPSGDGRQGTPHKAALLAGAIFVAILAVIVFAHAVRGNGTTPQSAASTSTMPAAASSDHDLPLDTEIASAVPAADVPVPADHTRAAAPPFGHWPLAKE